MYNFLQTNVPVSVKITPNESTKIQVQLTVGAQIHVQSGFFLHFSHTIYFFNEVFLGDEPCENGVVIQCFGDSSLKYWNMILFSHGWSPKKTFTAFCCHESFKANHFF
jgi:hypothetical protein